MSLIFFVEGTPVPKGSATAFLNRKTGKPIIVQMGRERQKPWASLISMTAQANKESQQFQTIKSAASVRLTFYMQRPKSHYNKSGLKEKAPRFPAGKPDIDKLARCVIDALTGIVWEDDSQVVEASLHKYYADDHRQGVFIEVSELV